MKTIQIALAPLLIIGSFCSLGSFEYFLAQSKRYLSYLYVFAIWNFYVYFIYRCHSITLADYTLHQIIIHIIVLIAIPISFFHSKELKMCLHELSIVDDTLEALGILKEYQQLRNWIIRIIFGWIIFISVTEVVEEIINYTVYEVSVLNIYVKFVFNIPKYVNLLNALICGVIIRCTQSRFQRVNDCLHVLYSDLLGIDADCGRQNRLVLVRQGITTGANEYEQYIWIIMHVHLQICLISHKLNKIFNVQIFLQMMPIFMFNIWMCCSMYIMYINRTDEEIVKEFPITAYYYLHIIISNILILTLNYICQTVYNEINNTVAILHELSTYNSDMALHEQILQFILQIKQREVKFGMGLVYFGYDFILKYYSSVLSVVVTLIQMDIYTKI